MKQTRLLNRMFIRDNSCDQEEPKGISSFSNKFINLQRVNSKKNFSITPQSYRTYTNEVNRTSEAQRTDNAFLKSLTKRDNQYPIKFYVNVKQYDDIVKRNVGIVKRQLKQENLIVKDNLVHDYCKSNNIDKVFRTDTDLRDEFPRLNTQSET